MDYHFVSTHTFEEHILNNRYGGYADVPLEVFLSLMSQIVPLGFVCSFSLSFSMRAMVTISTAGWLPFSTVFPVCARPRFIEYGRYNGHYYGTSLDSMHRVMAEGKVCLLDVHPSVSIMPSKSGSANTFSQYLLLIADFDKITDHFQFFKSL